MTCSNPVAFAHPKNMTLPKATVTFAVGEQEAEGAPVPVTVTSDAFALCECDAPLYFCRSGSELCCASRLCCLTAVRHA
eukprot:COSAG05_NODE_1183_length_5592_cov_2.043328_1_plen_79_part_00